MGKVIEQIYDIWQAPSFEEVQEQVPEQVQEQKQLIIVCRDERDWINPTTNTVYSNFIMCDIIMITKENMLNFKNRVIVFDDMGDKLNKDIACYFTDGRHHIIQMIVMSQKSAQINNTSRMSCDTV